MPLSRREFVRSLSVVGGAALIKACSRAESNELESNENFQPAYLNLEREGKFKSRVEEAYGRLESCDLCPHMCKVNRRAGKTGFCNAGERVKVYSHHAHFGEELPLVGRSGSGTIFFSNCNLRCVFCQNYPIAHEGRGREISDEALGDLMLNLQRRGCHNINVVTPTHMMPNILGALRIAGNKGLRIPLCYNTGGYELPEVIKILDGIADIYLPDLKFMDGKESSLFALREVPDYPKNAQESIIEMHRQVGDLLTDDRGIALKGLMIRHLVMPNRVAGTREFVKWVAENLTLDTYVNIMSQYRVEFRAFEFERIARGITSGEFVEAMEWALEAGLRNLDERSLTQLAIHRRSVGR